MHKPTLIAVPIVRDTSPLAQQVASARAAGADLVELRVDLIRDVDAVEALLTADASRTFILTIRAAEEGGAWDGSDAERVALYERLGLRLPGYVDVELRTWQRSANLRQKLGLVCARRTGGEARAAEDRPRNELILSMHDFSRFPADLDAATVDLLAAGAAICKVAFTADDATDALRMLAWTHRHASHRVIGIAMGAGGAASRVLARKAGAFLSFAAADGETGSAPGQIPVDVLRGLYRWDAIRARTAVFGVVGWPVGHSRSPAVHNALLAHHGIDGVYVPLPVAPSAAAYDRFMAAVEAEAWLDVRGLSVTLPHKEHAHDWLAARGYPLSDLGRRAGAVNTLVRSADGWRGENTDAAGALAALGAGGAAALRGARVLILGAGGVAATLAAALTDAGATVAVSNRTAARAAALASRLGCQAVTWEARGAWPHDLLINGTSVGMTPAADETPLPADALCAGAVVLDTVYTPAQTRLLREAAARGCQTVSGLEMFCAQAAAQHRAWHGNEPDARVLRTAAGGVR